MSIELTRGSTIGSLNSFRGQQWIVKLSIVAALVEQQELTANDLHR